LVDKDVSSKKLKISMKIIALTKAALKGTPEGVAFQTTIDNAKNLTEQKRYYISDYGFKNMVDFVNGTCDTLVKGDNYEKHNLENIVQWWKHKATNRYETLKSEGRLRTELEVWTSGRHIDIIR
jgi:AAA+ ATPase superfamily predicted ATPase